MRAALLLLVALLAGCASSLEIPKEIPVPVPTPCVDAKDVPSRPRIHTEAELLAMDQYRRTLQLWVDYWRLVDYAGKAGAIAERCSRIPQLKPAGGLGLRP